MRPEIVPGLAVRQRFSKNRFAKSTFVKIFSYSLFLTMCILLLTLCILYFSVKNIVTREIHNQSISLLVQTQSIFDSLHEWLVPSFRQIKSEPAISTLVNSRTLNRIQISAGMDRLLEVLSAYSLVDSIYVYNQQTGDYFSTVNGYEGLECSDYSLPAILQDIRRFGVYRYIARKMTYRIRDSVWRADLAKVDSLDVFSIVVGDMPDTGPTMQGAVIVNISVKKIIERFFPSASGSTSRLFIVDREGRVLAHPDPNLFGAELGGVPSLRKVLDSGKDEGVFTDTHEGKRYLVSYTTHPAWGWRFINTIAYEEIFHNLTEFLVIAVVVFVLLMVLSVCLSYVGSWRIYSPINTLFQHALNLKGSGFDQEATDGRRAMSDVQYVDRVLKGIIEDRGHLSRTIERNQGLVKQEVIRGLLLGELDSEALEDHREYLNDDLDDGPFLLAVLRLDNYHALAEKLHADEISRLFQALKELVSHFMPVRAVVLPLQRDHACIIVNLKDTAGTGRSTPEEVRTALLAVQETVKRQLGVTFTVGISDVFPSASSLRAKYDACLAATQLRFRFGGNSTIPAADDERPGESDYAFPEDKVQVLFQELALGRMPRVEQILDELLSGVRERSFDDYGFMLQSIAYQTSKYIARMNHTLKASAVALRGMLQLVKSSETLTELKSTLMETYSLVAEICQKKQGRRLEELAGRTRAYIEQHFQDVSLCTESIADVMGVTAYYVRIYKNAFGGSLSESINSIRLKYCEDQLANTRLSVKKIYQAAGFGNYSYFFTLFKKNTGLTPNQYRLQRTGSH